MRQTITYPLENSVQKCLCGLLEARNVFYFAVLNETAVALFKMFRIPEKTQFAIYNRFKSMGLRKGLPDLCILHNETIYFLELKRENGKLKPHQAALHKVLAEKGYHVATAYGYNQAIEILTKWGII